MICNEGPRSSLGNRDKGWKGSSINVEYIELDYTTPISHHTIHSRCAAHDLSRSMQMQEQRMTDDYSNSVEKTAFCPDCVHLYTHFRKAWFLLCKFPLFQVTEDSDVGHPSVLYLPPSTSYCFFIK